MCQSTCCQWVKCNLRLSIMRMTPFKFRKLVGCIIILFVSIVLLLHMFIEDLLESRIQNHASRKTEIHYKDINVPVILWWTAFTGEKALFKKCGNVECFFTENRVFHHHFLLKTIMFYGSKFDIVDLPLPRNGSHINWALLHEESPKNTPVLSHESALRLFNFTATFSRFSSFPLTLQYLPSLQGLMDHTYFVPVEQKNRLLNELAPVLYIHSDCNTPLERDAYVSKLIKYIRIDSYGSCLNNRELPKSLIDPMECLDSEEFLNFVARYKFTLAFENSVCNDYITEKLWRPLIVGSIPVYMGSPTVKDWLPNTKSAILVSDFESPEKLAKFLHQINGDNSLYQTYLEHKLNEKEENKISNSFLIGALKSRLWGLNDDFERGNFVDHFECFICKQSHRRSILRGEAIANALHYDCPVPVSPLTHETNLSNWWVDQWRTGQCEALALNGYVSGAKQNYTKEEFYNTVEELLLRKEC